MVNMGITTLRVAIQRRSVALQVAIVRQPFVRINMRNNQFPFHSTPFHQGPIPIQFIPDIHPVQIGHLRLPQLKLWRRPRMSLVSTLWQCKALPIQTPFQSKINSLIDV